MAQTAASELSSGTIDKLIGLAELAGPGVAAVVVSIVVVFLVLFFGLKYSGLAAVIGKRQPIVETRSMEKLGERIEELGEKITDRAATLDRRLSEVERDIEERATRAEVHRLELAFTRMEGRFEAIDQRTAATAHGVGRIESFMYESAMRTKGEK